MTEQIIAACNQAYAAGSAIATDPKTNPINDCPLWISTRELRNAFYDGFRDMRDEMYEEFRKKTTGPLLPGCKVKLLPARESDKFTKAADA